MIPKEPKTKAQFVKWMGPILDCLRNLGGQAKPKEVSAWIAGYLLVPKEVTDAVLESTGESRFHNQVAWARQYLIWEGLLDGSKRGWWTLTPKGAKTFLSEGDATAVFKKWVTFHAKVRKQAPRPKKAVPEIEPSEVTVPPDDADEAELLTVLMDLSPGGFERLCRRLLTESGFEGVTVTGQSHDRGIDGFGILPLNEFVSLRVVFQCKKYKGAVPRAHIGDFRNAMIGRADKGILFTTGTFSPEARREAVRDGAPPVELIDGEKLVSLLQAKGLGVKPKTVFEVDSDFFEQFE